MEKIVNATSIVCDTCQKTFEDHNQDSLFSDGEEALNSIAVSQWWCDGYGHHYCPKHKAAAKKEAKQAGINYE